MENEQIEYAKWRSWCRSKARQSKTEINAQSIEERTTSENPVLQSSGIFKGLTLSNVPSGVLDGRIPVDVGQLTQTEAIVVGR